MKQLNWKYAVSLTILTSTLMTSDATSASFRLRETNANGVGRAMAGEAASAEGKAAEQFDNVANLGFVEKSSVEASAIYIKTSAKFRAQNMSAPTTAGGGALLANNGGDAGGNFLVPAAYLALKMKKNLTLGFGLTMPFGLRTEYDRNWVGKSRAIVSDLKVVNINPAIAWRINPMVSVGVGLNIQHAEAELSRNVDFTAPIFGRGSADGTIRGKSWGYGGNFGILVAPTPATKVGLSWRTAVKHTLKGDSTYSNRSAAFSDAFLTGVVKAPVHGQKAQADMKLPDIVNLGGSWDINPAWRLLGTIEWTRWSTLKELRVKFPDSATTDSVEAFSYKNTMFYSIGALYRFKKHWGFKFGVAYDTTPTTLEHRSVRIPDENRTWFSMGTDYIVNNRLSFGLNYAYVYVRNADIDLKTTATGGDATRGTLKGNFKSDTHIVGAKFIYRW